MEIASQSVVAIRLEFSLRGVDVGVHGNSGRVHLERGLPAQIALGITVERNAVVFGCFHLWEGIDGGGEGGKRGLLLVTKAL